MNKTVDGLHLNKIYKFFIHVNARANFSRKFCGECDHYII